jgi:hypothetical protein
MGTQVAQFYSHQTLDVLVELIEAVSRDYCRNKPDRYCHLDRAVVGALTSFDKVGIDVSYPDKDTRARYFDTYLGDQFSAQAHPVLEQAKSLQKCAARYVELERADPNSANHCLDCVRVSANGLLQLLTGLTAGKAAQFRRAHARTGAIFQMTCNILSNASFAAAFGVNAIEDENWPETEYDRRGGLLVRQVLAVCDPVPEADGGLSDVAKNQLYHFKEFQDCAFLGTRTIGMVFDKDWSLRSGRHLATLGNAAARWHNAIRKLPNKVDRRRFRTAYVAELTEHA